MDVNSENFESEVLNSELPVVVDFWADWCAPCKAMTPVVGSLAEEMKDKVKILKFNAGEESALASDYGVRSIPAFLCFKNGKVVDSFVGSMGKDDLKEKITNFLNK